MEIKLRNRLSYRQAKTAVLAGLAIGIVLSAIQIGYDYAQELREIDTEVSDVINMFRESATQASYTVDETLAETVVKGLFEFQPIFDAKVIDEFGEVLGHKKRPVKGGKLEWLVGMIFGREKSYKVALLSTEGQKHLGQIELLVDNYLVARDFIHRAGIVIIGGLLRNICLAFIFLLIFYYTLTKPLLATVKGVFSVDPSRPSWKLLDFPKGHNKDEIGLLVRMINRLLEGFDKSLAGRQAAEEELKKHHDQLEELVEERTSELAKANDELRKKIDERMQAEEALRVSEEKYRNLFENSPFGIVICQLIKDDNNKAIDIVHLQANDATKLQIGFDLKDIIGKKASEIGVREEIAEPIKLYEQVISTGKPSSYIQYFPVYGRTLEVTAFHLIDDFFIINFINITDRKQAEKALRKSEELHKEAQRVAHIGHWELNPEIGTPVWSDEIFRIFGLNPQEKEPSFTDHETHLHPDDWPLLNRAVTLGSTEGTPFDIIFRIVRPDGEIRWMHAIGTTTKDEKGKVTKLFGTAQDITDLKQSEAALKKSEEKFRTFTEMAPVGVFVTDADGLTTYWNKRLCEITGMQVVEGLGTGWADGVHPDDRERVFKEWYESAEKRSSFSCEYRFVDRDGAVTHTIGQASPLIDASSRVTGYVGTITDVTDLKRAEEALRESEEKLARSEKMEAMGLMAGGVAHDLNNILSGIVSLPELLLMNLPEDSPIRKPIKTIQESGMRAADVVEDLMTIARGVASSKEPLNLNTMVEEYLKSAEHFKLERTHSFVSFKTELDPTLLNMSGSPTHIKKILMNLVANASEAIEGSGTVTISTLNQYLDMPLKGYEDVRTGEYAVVTVADDGSGHIPRGS